MADLLVHSLMRVGGERGPIGASDLALVGAGECLRMHVYMCLMPWAPPQIHASAGGAGACGRGEGARGGGDSASRVTQTKC